MFYAISISILMLEKVLRIALTQKHLLREINIKFAFVQCKKDNKMFKHCWKISSLKTFLNIIFMLLVNHVMWEYR